MKKLLFFIIACSSLFAGCGENETIYYEGEPDGTSGIYFAYYNRSSISGSSVTYFYTDTTSENSLANVSGEYAQISIPVRVFGEVSAEDRPFIVKVIGGTVEEGRDFTLPEELIMPKGEALAYVTVSIKKTEELQDGIVRYITLGLEENQFFKAHIKERIVGNDTIDTQRITIRYSLTLPIPFSWDFYPGYWGEYSQAKMNFILSVMGWTYREFDNKNLYQVGPTVCLLTRIELQKRADEGNPVRESDGSLMQLGSDYLVDYSAYE